MRDPHASVRILLVDDHVFTSLGVKGFLERHHDLDVVATASTASEALRQLHARTVDIAVIDLVIGDEDGLALVKQIHARMPEVGMIVLSMHDERIYAERVLRAGARGYVMKGEDPEMLVEAIRTVRRGDIHLSRRLRQEIAQRIPRRIGETTALPTEVLSDRELTVFRWLGEGLSSREIADSLHLSFKTVHTYRERIKAKLGLQSANELVHHAMVFASERKERRNEG